jgi:hypothetical protein
VKKQANKTHDENRKSIKSFLIGNSGIRREVEQIPTKEETILPRTNNDPSHFSKRALKHTQKLLANHQTDGGAMFKAGSKGRQHACEPQINLINLTNLNYMF